MECKNCKTVNADDSVYCKNCGTRLDGKKNCPSCGSVIDEDSIYCNACGARVDGKVVCKTCGTVHEGAYCPQCGSKTQAVGAKAERRANSAPAKAAIDPKSILNYISLGLVIAVAVLSIIFVCLIGVTLDTQGSGSESIGIFDYFGKEFEEAKDALGEMNGAYTAGFKDSLYLPAILGLISVIVSLLGTVAFAITGAVIAILNLVRKNGKSATVWVLLAFVCYMFGVSMIMSVNAVSVSATSSMVAANVKAVYNGATIAGIVLCTVTVAGIVGCDTTRYFMSEKFSAYKIVERVLVVVVAVGAVIAIAMLASPVATLNSTFSYDDVTLKGKMGSGLLGWFMLFAARDEYRGDVSQSQANDINLMETYVILGQVCIFIAVIAALLLIVAALNKDGKAGRILSITSSGIFLATTLIALIATVLAGNKYLPENITTSVSGVTYKMTYAPVIVALVFAVIAFASNVCRVVFGGKSKGNGGYSEEA